MRPDTLVQDRTLQAQLFSLATHGGSIHLGQKQTSRPAWPLSALPPKAADIRACCDMSALCRFCCRSPLQAFLVGDSVAVMRFATGAGDDGAAESLLPGAVFLFISSR